VFIYFFIFFYCFDIVGRFFRRGMILIFILFLDICCCVLLATNNNRICFCFDIRLGKNCRFEEKVRFLLDFWFRFSVSQTFTNKRLLECLNIAKDIILTEGSYLHRIKSSFINKIFILWLTYLKMNLNEW